MTHVEYNAPASEREIRRKSINRAAEAAIAANDNRIDRAELVGISLFMAFVFVGTAILLLVGGL